MFLGFQLLGLLSRSNNVEVAIFQGLYSDASNYSMLFNLSSDEEFSW